MVGLALTIAFAAPPELATPPGLSTSTQPAPLTLAQAASLAVSRARGVLIERTERRRAELGLVAARGGFIPELRLTAQYADAKGLAASGVDDRALQAGAELRYTSPIGTNAGLAVRHDAGSTDPVHGATVAVDVTQPLLKNGFSAGAGTPVARADVDLRLQRELFRQALNRFLADVDAAYWALAFAQADAAIKLRSRDRAQTQFEETRENIKRGILAPGELYIVEESLALFEQELVAALEARAQAASRLARLLEQPAGTEVGAADGLDAHALAPEGPEAALGTALRESPTLRGAQLQVERAQVRLAFDENQTLPALDVAATFRLNGLGDTLTAPYGRLDPARDRVFTAGLLFSTPLLDDADDARVARARLDREQQVLSLAGVETDVRFEITDVLRRLNADRRALVLAGDVVRLSKLKLEAELEKYKSGISTLADVVRFEREFDASLGAEQRAHLTLRSDETRLLSAEGVLHRARGVEVD